MGIEMQSGVRGVLASVQRDHHEIERLLGEVETAGGDRQQAVEALIRKLAVHETAEEEVVHPLAERAGASDVFEAVLEQEATAKKALARLDGLDVGSPEFERAFAQIRGDVLAHARYEETSEHPRIMASVAPERLDELARVFDIAEKTAPTRPHEHAPTSRAGNLAVGPIFAIADRVRDAVRDAKR